VIPRESGARRPLRAAALFGAMALVGCGPRGARPSAKAADGSGLAPVHVSPPTGTTIDEGCTPTGPELCFNAIDDNCNGVMDEGCGELTGVLQVAIAWASSPADVNLALVTPAGERVPPDHARAMPSGFSTWRDCPDDNACGGQNAENIAFDGLDPPRGHYVVEVTLADLRGAEVPVRVHLGARIGGRVLGFELELSPGDEAKKTLTFDLP
jgi:tRNA (guanosine-2'-O-)-methyltransferase